MKKKIQLYLASVIIILILGFIISSEAMASEPIRKENFQIKTIHIQKGDTLWKIANTYYSREYRSIEEYIEVIKKCNNLGSDSIKSGSILAIPYYLQ